MEGWRVLWAKTGDEVMRVKRWQWGNGITENVIHSFVFLYRKWWEKSHHQGVDMDILICILHNPRDKSFIGLSDNRGLPDSQGRRSDPFTGL